VDKNQIFNVGGTVEKAVVGDYSINIKQVLTEAWTKTQQSRISINIGILVSLMIGMFVTTILGEYMGGIEQALEDPQSRFMINIIVTLVVSPFLAGVEMMGVFHAIGLKTKPQMVFSFLSQGALVALCSLLVSTLTSLGFALFVVPGFFLLVTLSLTIMLVVEKKMTPIKAIILSVKALRFQFFHILALYSILFMLTLCSLFPLLILYTSELSIIGIMIFLFSLTYIVPLFFNVKGIIYREVFGVELQSGEAQPPANNGNFSA